MKLRLRWLCRTRVRAHVEGHHVRYNMGHGQRVQTTALACKRCVDREPPLVILVSLDLAQCWKE